MARSSGLVGLYGHTYEDDEEAPGERKIQHQFRIIRSMPAGRWVCQLFSFWDGRPIEVRVYEESFLLGADVRLYLEEEEFHHVYQQHAQSKMARSRRSNLTSVQ
jgi:hypothetical protein